MKEKTLHSLIFKKLLESKKSRPEKIKNSLVFFDTRRKQTFIMNTLIRSLFIGFIFFTKQSLEYTTTRSSLCGKLIPIDIDSENTNSPFTITTSSVRIDGFS